MRLFFLSIPIFCGLFLMPNLTQAEPPRSTLSPPLLTATRLDQPKLIAPFTLKDTQNQPFTEKNLKNHWTWLFFGFTRCGYVCPMSMTALKQAYIALEKNPNIPKPEVVFISIDPERDDSSRIHRYVTSFNPHFKGATGEKTALHQLTSQLGILYLKIIRSDQKDKTMRNYDIDHSGSILLINPEGELVAVFSMPHQPDRMVHDYIEMTSRTRVSR